MRVGRVMIAFRPMRTLTFNAIIGNGAMGTVYHAELRVPRGFARQCAVKVMKSTSPDQEHFRARMRDEARLLGMLQDEQILGVSELVQVEGRDCVVMEYVEGVDLGDLVATKTVPARALAELGAEVAGTVHRAHIAAHPTTGTPLEVIHRDVKPANVMITSRGGVRLLDFGVARAAFAARESQTHGLVLGTLNYFPPEILAGGEPTPAVDIYGLGLTMWECATGKDWGSPQVHKHRFERRVEQRLAEIGTDYEALVPILGGLLQWDPERRPSGAEAERTLLAAADTCSGAGLRTWGREVVPPILIRRKADARPDDLVGRTLDIDSRSDDEIPVPAAGPEAVVDAAAASDLGPPLAVPRTPAPAERRKGPPLAEADTIVVRPADREALLGLTSDVLRGPQPTRAPPPPRKRSLLRTGLLLAAASVVGAAIGLGLLSVAVLLGWLIFG